MLKAKKISAVSIQLADGVEAVFVQEGDDWNALREYRCLSPAAYVGQSIITAPDPNTAGRFSVAFDGLFGRLEESIIVMASPEIGAAIKAVSSQPKSA